MNNRFGPIRLIALQCGKFDYAEIELDRPLHLVGPNNVGKTSLIALLQFLYLDEQKSMRFSREMQETRKYYFPTVFSYALFECLTPTGYQTVGVRGCGPIRQYEFERFTYMGRFDETLFLDADRRVRPFDDIRAGLASKGYTPLTPATLRAALTGVGDSQKVMLGLVPAKNRDTYNSFRALFCNILRLSHIRQEEMKSLLLALFSKRFHQPDGIDLARTYQESFDKVKRDTRSVQMLKDLVPDIERALAHREKRDASRRRIPGLYLGVMAAAQTMTNQLQRDRAALDARRAAIATELEQAEGDTAVAQAELTLCTQTLTRLNDWLAETNAMEKALADFMPDWNVQRLAEVERLSDSLARRLGNLTAEPMAQVKARLKQHQADVSRLKNRLANVEHTVIQSLRRHFPDKAIEDAFRLLNPELLGLPLDRPEPGVAVTNIQAVVAALQKLSGQCGGGSFSGLGVTITLEALIAPALDRFGDPQHIKDEIGTLEDQIRRDEQLCRDAEEAETLRHQKQRLEQERRDLLRRQEKFEELRIRREQLDDNRHRQGLALEADNALNARIRALAIRMWELSEEKQTLRNEDSRIQGQGLQIQTLLAGVVRPPESWAVQPVETVPGDLEDLAARYRKDSLDQQRQDEALHETLKSIEERTYSRYAGADENESLQRLKEAHEALPGQEQAASELWRSIAVGIRENLQNMGSDLETLRVQINSINRRLAGIAVSNLKSLRLAIVEDPQWNKRIRNIRLQDDMPLFAETGAADQAFDEIGRLLSERPRIALDDLFNLEFEITMPDDTVRKYPHLDRIESNGTTIAIKVLVNLSLLKYLLDDADVAIPFYLDECSSLDSDNLHAIVETAQAMGFNAILASPEAMDAAGRLYFMREQENGRVILDPRSALVESLAAGEEPGGGGGDA